jgi:hypothetical protein
MLKKILFSFICFGFHYKAAVSTFCAHFEILASLGSPTRIFWQACAPRMAKAHGGLWWSWRVEDCLPDCVSHTVTKIPMSYCFSPPFYTAFHLRTSCSFSPRILFPWDSKLIQDTIGNVVQRQGPVFHFPITSIFPSLYSLPGYCMSSQNSAGI